MQKYRLGERVFTRDDDNYNEVIAAAYAEKQRPVCLCSDPPAEMYIAHIFGGYHLKRMPGTGGAHSNSCQSYEFPLDLSGRGEIAGTAIQQDAEGTNHLKLAFALRKNALKPTAEAEGEKSSKDESATLAASTNRMTILALLHYLWDEAGLNRWQGSESTPRTWDSVREQLLLAASSTGVKRTSLYKKLYVPETYSRAQDGAITQRRMKSLAPILEQSAIGLEMMIVVAEVARCGATLVCTELPSFTFSLDAKLAEKLQKLYDSMSGLARCTGTDNHIVAIATFYMSTVGIPSVAEVALMVTNHQWIPFDHSYEAQVLQTLHADDRDFTKILRFNLSRGVAIGSFVLNDTLPSPTVLYVSLGNMVREPSVDDIRRKMESSELPSWLWVVTETGMPTLPSRNTEAAPAVEEDSREPLTKRDLNERLLNMLQDKTYSLEDDSSPKTPATVTPIRTTRKPKLVVLPPQPGDAQ